MAEYSNDLVPALMKVSDYLNRKVRDKTYKEFASSIPEKLKGVTDIESLAKTMQTIQSEIYSKDILTPQEMYSLSNIMNQYGAMQQTAIQDSLRKRTEQGIEQTFDVVSDVVKGQEFRYGEGITQGRDIIERARGISDPKQRLTALQAMTSDPINQIESLYFDEQGKPQYITEKRSKSGKSFTREINPMFRLTDGRYFVDRNRNEEYDEGEEVSPQALSQLSEFNYTNYRDKQLLQRQKDYINYSVGLQTQKQIDMMNLQSKLSPQIFVDDKGNQIEGIMQINAKGNLRVEDRQGNDITSKVKGQIEKKEQDLDKAIKFHRTNYDAETSNARANYVEAIKHFAEKEGDTELLKSIGNNKGLYIGSFDQKIAEIKEEMENDPDLRNAIESRILEGDKHTQKANWHKEALNQMYQTMFMPAQPQQSIDTTFDSLILPPKTKE